MLLVATTDSGKLVKRHFDDALWLPTDFTSIGENQRGDHVRVHYLPGALAPPLL